MITGGDDEDTPEQEAARVRQAIRREAVVLIDALRRVATIRGGGAIWLREMAARIEHEGITPEERRHLARIAWFYRRQLPRHLAPRCNPADPIVMELERQGAEVHG